MGFLAPFVIGLITGSVALWQWGRRKSSVPEAVRTAAPSPVTEQSRAVESPAAKASKPTLSEADDLTAIRGIGPVYAKRLNAAGIQNFVQLAELEPEQITDLVVQGNIDKLVDTPDWIVQAQRLTNTNMP